MGFPKIDFEQSWMGTYKIFMDAFSRNLSSPEICYKGLKVTQPNVHEKTIENWELWLADDKNLPKILNHSR